MPNPIRTSALGRRVARMRRDTIWYTAKGFYDDTDDPLVCPSSKDVERMEKRREDEAEKPPKS
ncbi:hypothetical protein [Oceanidesulfovibrio marinus]|uniref:Uncharacterized protein n=1 Tax=Oceanidesulfovibrio marinus TaxID=370038 RepID=A0A6P1ZCP8_9BACT|nr:hypothetical protein [Oceanidesulfovibrio marinus]QJT10912.1 hypothetical protein E8L03_19225 [Oceanidesulfovibrio marinus]TVM30824.1 hypothetical protein DQK91_19805 [Oceanidesulfovibrio marinus]